MAEYCWILPCSRLSVSTGTHSSGVVCTLRNSVFEDVDAEQSRDEDVALWSSLYSTSHCKMKGVQNSASSAGLCVQDPARHVIGFCSPAGFSPGSAAEQQASAAPPVRADVQLLNSGYIKVQEEAGQGVRSGVQDGLHFWHTAGGLFTCRVCSCSQSAPHCVVCVSRELEPPSPVVHLTLMQR